MELVILGSGSVAPSPERTAPAYWITAGNTKLLLECGAGTLHRAAAQGIPWSEATHVAISHFHVDHWGELPAFLFALRWGIEPPRTAPITLIGPSGFHTRLRLTAGALGDWVLDPGYPVAVREIAPEGTIELSHAVVLEAHKTVHTEHSVAYAVRDTDARLVYTGDTGPDESLARWAEGCDLLLAECSLPDHRAIDVHLTPSRAGQMARAAKAGQLILTHFYPVFGDSDPAEIAAEAFRGSVTRASDGDRFRIGKKA